MSEEKSKGYEKLTPERKALVDTILQNLENGDGSAYYRPSTDEIHVPKKEMFFEMPEFYTTVLHEIGHSTGHKSRLNRDLSGEFGTRLIMRRKSCGRKLLLYFWNRILK